jgi:hypothetical protein
MRLTAKTAIYLAAGAALVVGAAAYAALGEEHEDEGLIAGDLVKVAVVGGVLAVVAIISFVYLAKGPPKEG